MPKNKTIIINSRKIDGSIHKSWTCELVEETPDYYVFLGIFQSEVRHAKIGVIRPNTISYEYYWKRKGYNIFHFVEPEGDFRNFYCNINLPPAFSDDVLDYVDLDVDVLVWKDLSYEVLDLDEFEENAVKYGYSSEIRKRVEESLSELIALIEKQQFPFDINA